jgi:hypothetical protein
MIPTPRHGDVENGPEQVQLFGSQLRGVPGEVAGGEAHRPRPRSVGPAHIFKTVRGGSAPKSGVSFERPRCCTSTIWPRLSTLLSPLEWRGGRREDPVVGVRFVARGDGDQGRLCEGSAHELETDREAISGEASRYSHGGKATIRG